VARREHERREQHALHADPEQRRVRLPVVPARQRGELERVAGQPAAGHPPGPRHRDDLGEHLLHPQRGPDLDAQPRLLVARVRERVHDAGVDLDDVARTGHPGAQADAKAHAAGEHLEALGLDRVHVRDRHRAAGAQGEVEGEQLAAGARRGVREREALAGDRVLERLAWSDHAGMLARRSETVHGLDAQDHA